MSDSFDELSARARRGELSRAERQRLNVFLKSSLEARLWHDAGRQLDAEDSVLPGDHDAAQRVMQRALAAFPVKKRAGRRSRVGVLLAAAALFGVSAAAAAVEGVRYWHAHRQNVEHVNVTANEPSRKLEPTRLVASAAAVVVATAPLPAPSAGVASLVGESPAALTSVVHAKPKADATNAAAQLFSAAALSRREGNAVKAIALLDSLQEHYPGSREAHQSDMTLGALHLQRGAAAAALEHFRRYLRVAPQGELAPEAVWGQYQALTALGRHAEAQRRLQLLAERYPGSAYASTARSKLKAESASP